MSTSKLRRGQLCPLHRSYFCCGRETVKRRERFDKPKFTEAEVKRQVEQWVQEQFDDICRILGAKP